MDEMKDPGENSQGTMYCPNCEEDVLLPKKNLVGKMFPCPNCSFLISSDSGAGKPNRGSFQKTIAFVMNDIFGKLGIFFSIFIVLILIIYAWKFP